MIKLNFKSINILKNIYITELLIRLMDLKIEVKSIINSEFNAEKLACIRKKKTEFAVYFLL